MFSSAICAIARPWEALLIGFIGSAFACFGYRLLEKRNIDDPVGCVSTHAFAGIWAVISVSLFAEKDNILKHSGEYNGILKGGNIQFFGIQAFGVVVITCWAIITSYATLYVIDKLMGLRVTLLEEIIGADLHEHGIADINDPGGLLQIRKFLPRGAKMRLAQTRQRMFSVKQPRHRIVYSFSDATTRKREASVANANETSHVPGDHGNMLRKRFRQGQNQSSPTIKRVRRGNSLNARKNKISDLVDRCVVAADSHTDGRFDSVHEHNANQQSEILSMSQISILMSSGESCTSEENPSQTFQENIRSSPSLSLHLEHT